MAETGPGGPTGPTVDAGPTGPTGGTAPTVDAVILAFADPDLLAGVVAAVGRQTIRPRRTLVVDNGARVNGADGAAPLDVEWLVLAANAGVGAGHNAGWRRVVSDGRAAFVWALEHDSLPEAHCLERLLAAAAADHRRQVGAFLPPQAGDESEGIAKAGRLPATEEAREGITFNGALVRVEAIRSVGYLREDFFVGFEDREYSDRLRAGGWQILRVRQTYVVHRNKRSHRGGPTSPGRAYYSSRNAARLRLERCSFAGGWVVAEAGRVAGACVRIVARRRRPVADHLRSRVLASADAAFNRMGRRDHRWGPESTPVARP